MPGGKHAPLIIVKPHIDYLADAAVAVREDQRDIIILLYLLDILVKGSQEYRPFRFPGTKIPGHIGIIPDEMHHGLIPVALYPLNDIPHHGGVEGEKHRVHPPLLHDYGDDMGRLGRQDARRGIRYVAVLVYDFLYLRDILIGNFLVALVHHP